ncbi:MAG: hypothetical protein ACLQE9_12625 [Roseiarcus sp.]
MDAPRGVESIVIAGAAPGDPRSLHAPGSTPKAGRCLALPPD